MGHTVQSISYPLCASRSTALPPAQGRILNSVGCVLLLSGHILKVHTHWVRLALRLSEQHAETTVHALSQIGRECGLEMLLDRSEAHAIEVTD